MIQVDNKIVKKAKAGDKTAFEKLYLSTHDDAKKIAQSIRHNEYDAEDLVQESYIKLMTNFSSLNDDEKFAPFFNRIVANTCKDYQKKKKPKLFTEVVPYEEAYDDFEQSLVVTNKDDYVSEEVEKHAVSKRVQEAVYKLPDAQRTCIVLHYYCEMTVDEIARIYGLSRNTVISRLSYGRKKLKKELQKDKNKRLF